MSKVLELFLNLSICLGYLFILSEMFTFQTILKFIKKHIKKKNSTLWKKFEIQANKKWDVNFAYLMNGQLQATFSILHFYSILSSAMKSF